ncbi:MFS transporter [Pengzhenrongella sicca]|uniref:MFS transporter n=1 Tax=Pengzhenrongella sicca TaxID=2819238 RepID=A0A8A4ZHJ9_9MICO|nr:MFS transporter [Pengzhenrongella sicca]QTE29108.1 MFS transporter [Pengzhenrongella sicca]
MRHPRPAAPQLSAPRPPAPRPLVLARWLMMSLFALNGTTMASWLSRLPSVSAALDLAPSELGVVLLAGAVGALAMVLAAGVIVTRFGGRIALHATTAGFTLAFVLLGLGPTLGRVDLLTAGIFLAGVSFALGGVPMNVESSAIERRLGRTVLPQFHAAFSIGAVLGSGIGALSAHLDVSLLGQFLATAAISALWRLAITRHVILDPADDGAGGPVVVVAGGRVGLRAALKGWREPRTLQIGVVIMAAAFSEGAANDWLALAVVDGFGEPESVGAIVYGVFVASMTVVRLLGTRLIDRYGRVAVLLVSGLVSLGGLVLFGVAPSLPLAAVGVVAWGLGAGLAVPNGIAAASDDPLRAAGRVAVVSAFSSTASLAAPPLLGLAAEGLGTRHALVLITIAMVASVSLSGRVAREPAAEPAIEPAAAEPGRGGMPESRRPDAAPPSASRVDHVPAGATGETDSWGTPVTVDRTTAGVR